MRYCGQGYTQKMALELVKANLEKGTPFLDKYGDMMTEYQRAMLLSTINNMIKVRTRTPEQIERENERRREARAKKRAQRDEEILTLIKPYIEDKPHTASELELRTQGAVKAGEIRSYFKRHPDYVITMPPRTERLYEIRVY